MLPYQTDRGTLVKKIVLASILLLTTTSLYAIPQPAPTKTTLKLPAFSAIHATGRMNLIITGTKSNNPSDTVVENKNPQWVEAKVQGHVLYLRALNAAEPSRTPPIIKVHLYQLDKLDVYGRVTITGTDIKSDGLYMRADNTRDITLNGKLVVDQIRNYGPGHITLKWVSGNAISVQSYAGEISLAGKAKQLRVKLRNHAVLDAQYLRTQHVLAQTKDFSVAKVLPIDSLRAFATDFSNIYFYKTPQHLSRYTNRSGNVLQMGRRH